MMNKMLHPDFAAGFIWAGRLTEKHASKQLKLKNVIYVVYIQIP